MRGNGIEARPLITALEEFRSSAIEVMRRQKLTLMAHSKIKIKTQH
jgi:hypothetical protein